jgi:AraC-like DNA-binding protein
MNYREIPPIPELAGIVQCIWMLEGDGAGAGEPEPVLPDGRPELVLHFADRFERIGAEGGGIAQPSMIFAGQVTSPLLLRPTGRAAVVGVRFHAHGAASVLPMPQHEIAGLTIDVASLAAGLSRELAAVVEDAGGLIRAAAAVQRVLLPRVRPDRIDPRVRFAVEAIERTRGRLQVDALSRATNMTRRHLERRFLEDVGISPKRLSRIARFQHALRMLQRFDRHTSGAETAAACGYSDQSHFIRDFRALAGCSPSEHLLRQGELTGFFIGDPRSPSSLAP